jgi:hypothetical protein
VTNLFSSKKTEKQETQIDPRIYNEVLQNLGLARQVSQIPFEPYRGMMVAPFTRDYMQGEQMTRDIARQGGFVPEVEGAARQAQRLMGFTPQQVAAERLGTTFGSRDIGASLAGGPERVSAGRVGTQFAAPTIGAERVGTTFSARDVTGPGAAPTAQAASFLGQDLQAYMNPYQQGVIDVGLSDIDRASEQARMQRAQRATAARAFGGSRAAIEEGIAAGEAARERNRFIAEQRAQAFREAAGLREADVGREQQTALANQQAIQNVMQLAQAGQISNQERDIRLQQLGATAQQTNQAAMLEMARANQQAQMQAQELGTRAEQFNVEQGLRAGMSNQQAVQDYMRMGLTAEQANQQANLDAQRMGLTAGQSNQEAALRAALANQQAGFQGAEFQLGAGRQFADLGQQALQNRYGAAAAMTGLGSAQQQLMQQYLNAQQQEFMRRTQYPLQQLAVAQGAVAASPYNQTTWGTTRSTPPPWQMIGQALPVVTAAFSDERMKENIKPIKNPLDKVNRLEGVTFNWKDDDDDYEDASIIAQDVEKVMPEAVMKNEDGMRMVSVPQMVGLLTGAVQELDKKLERKSRQRTSA